ncbi:hypothetical protein FIU89_05440 [Roseovarius sp. THAF27]|nr:hypothetical protein FIU89_05440 [Roseovarius sp. THAF27]QFT96851.1 hypothetical protein FIU85_06035 [Roseovarius sp. THAF8]
MRYPASEKLEIIRIVEQSHLPVKRTLGMLGIPRTTFYRWYDRYLSLGEAGLEDQSSRPGRVWTRIPDTVRRQIVDLALDEPELSPRDLAVRFTDTKRYFVSEASVYRLLKAHDLVTSPALAVIKAADEFHEKTTRSNQLWQTDFTYLKVIGHAGGVPSARRLVLSLDDPRRLQPLHRCLAALHDDPRRGCHIDLGGCLGCLRMRRRDGRP